MEAEKAPHSYISLLFANGVEYAITPLHDCRGMTNNGIRPEAFIWHHPELILVNQTIVKWATTEFIPCFNSNDFKWAASCATLTQELQKLLQRH